MKTILNALATLALFTASSMAVNVAGYTATVTTNGIAYTGRLDFVTIKNNGSSAVRFDYVDMSQDKPTFASVATSGGILDNGDAITMRNASDFGKSGIVYLVTTAGTANVTCNMGASIK